MVPGLLVSTQHLAVCWCPKGSHLASFCYCYYHYLLLLLLATTKQSCQRQLGHKISLHLRHNTLDACCLCFPGAALVIGAVQLPPAADKVKSLGVLNAHTGRCEPPMPDLTQPIPLARRRWNKLVAQQGIPSATAA